jgi:hypothetical protein
VPPPHTRQCLEEEARRRERGREEIGRREREVMEFSTGALGVLVPKLRALLQEEHNLQKSVNGWIKYLMAELESMQGDLQKVSGMPMFKLDKKVMDWARYVQELSYDMDDSVDNILVQVEGMDPTRSTTTLPGSSTGALKCCPRLEFVPSCCPTYRSATKQLLT